MRTQQNLQGLFTLTSFALLAAACSGADGVDTTGGYDDVGPGDPPVSEAAGPTVSGTVRDGIDGAVVAGAQICSAPMSGPCAETDDGGHFTLTGIEPGTELPLYVLAEGYVSSRVDVRVGEGGASREVLLLPTESVDLGDGMGTSAGVLFRVLSPSYMQPTPIEGAAVQLGALETLYTNDEARFDATYGQTGADGLALIMNVPLGNLEISAVDTFGEGCLLAAKAGLVDDVTVAVAAGAIVTMDVFCH